MAKPYKESYLSNPDLKRAGVKLEWTKERILEFQRCMEDPIYFIETYMKIINVDHGLVPFIMYDYQKEMITAMKNNRRCAFCLARQSGKSITTCAFLLWYILFNSNKTVALLANKLETAREILGRVQLAYQNLPFWLQSGVIEFNKGSFALENGSEIIASATSSSNIRGRSCNIVYIDEAAFVERWDEFFASVYPTITSGKTTQLFMTSTPNGMNHFYEVIDNGRKGVNGYYVIEVPWDRVPGRDSEWYEETIAALNYDHEKFDAEFNIEFLGSSGTLIAGWKLKQLESKIAIEKHEGLSQFEKPIPERKYAMICDVSHGAGQDYSAFSIIDVTEIPYKQVCTYRNNTIPPTDYASIINSTGKLYNEALLLIETNDIGENIAYILFEEHLYENLVRTMSDGALSRKTTMGFGGGVGRIERGVRTNKKVKSVGCSILKLLIEHNKLIINDKDTIFELATFSRKGEAQPPTYEAEAGKHDDLVMGLVLFAWLTEQDHFKNYCDIHTLSELRKKSDDQLMQELMPFLVDDKLSDPETEEFKIDGDLDPTRPEFDAAFGRDY